MKPGDWVEWHLPGVFLRRCRVLRAEGVSLELQVLGSDQSVVIPVREYAAGELRRIAEPPRASLIDQAQAANMMTPDRAAAILGVDLKRLRAMLREGRLQGRQVNGKWLEVDPDSVEDLRS